MAGGSGGSGGRDGSGSKFGLERRFGSSSCCNSRADLQSCSRRWELGSPWASIRGEMAVQSVDRTANIPIEDKTM